MNLFKQYCKAKYYGEFDSAAFLLEAQKNIDPDISLMNKEFQNIFHYILNTDPCSYWNKDVYSRLLTTGTA